MRFDEMDNMNVKPLMLLPGTACDDQTNFGAVLDRLAKKENGLPVSVKKRRRTEP